MDLSERGRFHIAPGYDPALPETWVWEDRSADVHHTTRPAVQLTGGRGDEVSQVEAGSCSLLLDNAGGHYCTQNPYGRWYGKLALGCPARWGTISGAESFTANTTNGWGTPDVGISWNHETPANWSSSGGMGRWSAAGTSFAAASTLVGADARNGDATWVCSTAVVATGASLYYALLARRSGPSSTLLFTIEFQVGGGLNARIRRDHNGVAATLAQASAGTYTAGQRIKARAQWDGQDLRLRVWPEASAEPTTWTVTATDDQCTGSQVGLWGFRLGGNTNPSPVVFSFDDLEIEAVELVGTVPRWPVRWDPTAQVSWTPIEIAGIVRRLGQDEDPLRSPMRRQISGYSRLVGYWPLEDGSEAKQATNAVPGAPAASTTGMNFGSGGPAGSASAATFAAADSSSKIAGTFKSASVSAGWQFSWTARLDALPSGPTSLITWATTNGYTWRIGVDTGKYTFLVTDADGFTVYNAISSFVGTGEPNQWITFRAKATASGGTINFEFSWFAQDATFIWGTSPSFAGAVGALRNWWAEGNSNMGSAAICHVFGVTTGLDSLLAYAAIRAFDGYARELAADRVARLCGESGVPVTVEPGNSEALGPQGTGTLLELLRAAEAADLGVLYEAGAGLGYRPRGARYNRPVDMALTIAADGDVADPPEPATDDQQISNAWTVTRTGGSEDNASDPVHIALNGRRPRSTTINVASDARLVHHAGWRVHLGTWGEYRWPQITLMLTDRPALLAAWRGRPFGSRLTISGVPAQGPIGADLDLIVEGWSQSIDSDGWQVVLNCSPARPWDVAVWDQTRYDSQTTTLKTGVAAGATSVVFRTTNLAVTWLTGSNPAGLYDVTISGEVVRVTAMGAASLVSGAREQTATIVRSINGISKALPAGAEIRLADARRWSL